jgi:hypothetical protein
MLVIGCWILDTGYLMPGADFTGLADSMSKKELLRQAERGI